MARPFINKNSHVQELLNEIKELEGSIEQLQRQIVDLQRNCQHFYTKTAGYRKCRICLKVEIDYY